MIAACKECAALAARHGVIIAIQNHNEFVQSAEQVNYLMDAVNEACLAWSWKSGVIPKTILTKRSIKISSVR